MFEEGECAQATNHLGGELFGFMCRVAKVPRTQKSESVVTNGRPSTYRTARRLFNTETA